MDSNINKYIHGIKRILNQDESDDNIIKFRKNLFHVEEKIKNKKIDDAIKLIESNKELLGRYPKIQAKLKPLLEYLGRINSSQKKEHDID